MKGGLKVLTAVAMLGLGGIASAATVMGPSVPIKLVNNNNGEYRLPIAKGYTTVYYAAGFAPSTIYTTGMATTRVEKNGGTKIIRGAFKITNAGESQTFTIGTYRLVKEPTAQNPVGDGINDVQSGIAQCQYNSNVVPTYAIVTYTADKKCNVQIGTGAVPF